MKVIKKSSLPVSSTEIDADDEENDNLPPPSPPPGSPPPHIFPPRVKATMINNIHPSFVLNVQAVPPPPPPIPVSTGGATQQSNPFVTQQLQLQQHQQQLYNPGVSRNLIFTLLNYFTH